MLSKNVLLVLAYRLQQVQLRLSATALAALMLVTCADVVMRYLNRPVHGSYEIVECLLLVCIFHGMASAVFGRLNIVIDLFDPFFGPRGASTLIRLSDLLSVVVLGLVFWAMLGPASQAYQYNDIKTEIRLPVFVLWGVALAGLAGSVVCALVVLFAKPAVPQTERLA